MAWQGMAARAEVPQAVQQSTTGRRPYLSLRLPPTVLAPKLTRFAPAFVWGTFTQLARLASVCHSGAHSRLTTQVHACAGHIGIHGLLETFT